VPQMGMSWMEKPESIELEKVPSGKRTKSYWKWPFIVDLPIENGDFP
jgi:hypothetical protein